MAQAADPAARRVEAGQRVGAHQGECRTGLLRPAQRQQRLPHRAGPLRSLAGERRQRPEQMAARILPQEAHRQPRLGAQAPHRRGDAFGEQAIDLSRERGRERQFEREMEGLGQPGRCGEAEPLRRQGQPEPDACGEARRDQSGEEIGAPQRGDRPPLAAGMGVGEAGQRIRERAAGGLLGQRARGRVGIEAQPAGEGDEGPLQGGVEGSLSRKDRGAQKGGGPRRLPIAPVFRAGAP